MDYTKVPRALIYRERRQLEDFAEESEVNSLIIDNIIDNGLFDSVDGKSRALICYNTAYYLCTLILHCDQRPEWDFAKYCDIAFCGDYNDSVPQAFTLSLVNIFLTHAYYDVPCKKLLQKLEKYLSGHCITNFYSYRDAYKDIQSNLPDDFLIHENFAPRFIDQAAVHEVSQQNGFDWVRFSNYYEERTVRDVVDSLGQTPEEKHNVIEMLRQAADLFYSSDNNYVNTVNNLLDVLDKPFVEEPGSSTIKVNHQSDTQERKKQVVLAQYESRIQELEKENEELRLQNEQLQQNENLRSAIQEIKRLKEENTTLLVGFLEPAFYNDEGYTRNFLKEIAGKDNQGVTDVARKWLHDGKITPSKKGRFIWEILRIAKLYDATEQNWTAAMRKKD